MRTKLTAEQALYLEREHNVCIDRHHEMVNHSSRHDAMSGWEPIPPEWIDQATDTKTTLVDVVKRACKAERNSRYNTNENEVNQLFTRWLDGQIYGDIDLGKGASAKDYTSRFIAECGDYCTQNGGDCSTCSLANYGRDCHNNVIRPASETAHQTSVRVRRGLLENWEQERV